MPDAPEGGTTTTSTTGGGTDTTTPQGGEKTFTQVELDRIVGERVAREKARFADFDALKQKADEFDRLTEAQKTELQKAQDKAADSERRALQLEAEVADTRLRSTVTSVAARKGIVDPDAAFQLLDRSLLNFDQAGAPTNLETVLDDLVKAKPYLANRRPGNGSGEGGPRGGTAPDKFDGNAWLHGLRSAKT